MNYFIKNLNNIIYKLISYIILFYQKIISPLIPARCRYYPTCSHYGKQAIEWHGVWVGGWLLLKRIGRCHPLGGQGIDFVPLPLATYHYYPLPLMVGTINSGFGVYKDNQSYVCRLNQLMSCS